MSHPRETRSLHDVTNDFMEPYFNGTNNPMIPLTGRSYKLNLNIGNLFQFHDENEDYGPYSYNNITKFDDINPKEKLEWIPVAKSAYGLFISEVLKHDNSGNWIFLLIQALVAGIVQGSIIIYLWQSLPRLSNSPFRDSSKTSSSTYFLLLAIIIVFLSSLAPSFVDTIHDFRIAIYSDRYLCETDNISYVKDDVISTKDAINMWIKKTICAEHPIGVIDVKPFNLQRCMAIITVIYESVIWIAVLMVGILYIISTDGVGNIIQAAVAITFVNEIDNMTVLLLPKLRKNKFEAYKKKYRITLNILQDVIIIFKILFHLFGFGPFLIAASIIIIYGLKTVCY